jgi:hypothetical protein
VNQRRLAKLEAHMRESPANVAYGDLIKVCEHYFGEPCLPWRAGAVCRSAGTNRSAAFGDNVGLRSAA